MSFRYDFGKHEKDTSIDSSGMNTMFDIHYNFRLGVKFSTHIINIRRKTSGFSRTNYFSPIVVLVFVLATALTSSVSVPLETK